jgi:hypothetical protein
MSRALRLALTWLLAVALPVQGVSAATMLACGLGHHEHLISEASVHSHGHTATHVHALVASAHDSDVSVPPGKTDLGKGTGHKCSACASCCLGVAVPTEIASFDTIQLPEVFAPLVARTLAAYFIEGLERPPRTFLA